jgi:hypothetical protein
MRMRLFACHHLRPQNPINTELFCSMVTGMPRGPSDVFLSDLDGENIAHKEDYCELRQQFFVWKNLLSNFDFVGFEHYRRLFLIDPYPSQLVETRYPRVWRQRLQVFSNTLPWVQEVSTACLQEYVELRRDLDAASVLAVKRWIASYDIIVTRPHHENIRLTWEKAHATAIETWHQLMLAFQHHSYFRNHPRYIHEGIVANYYLNMYIMRAEYFNEYMYFWEELLFHLESITPVLPFPRLWGHLSERIFSLYLYQKRMENPLLRVAEMPYLRADLEIGDELSTAEAT